MRSGMSTSGSSYPSSSLTASKTTLTSQQKRKTIENFIKIMGYIKKYAPPKYETIFRLNTQEEIDKFLKEQFVNNLPKYKKIMVTVFEKYHSKYFMSTEFLYMAFLFNFHQVALYGISTFVYIIVKHRQQFEMLNLSDLGFFYYRILQKIETMQLVFQQKDRPIDLKLFKSTITKKMNQIKPIVTLQKFVKNTQSCSNELTSVSSMDFKKTKQQNEILQELCQAFQKLRSQTDLLCFRRAYQDCMQVLRRIRPTNAFQQICFNDLRLKISQSAERVFILHGKSLNLCCRDIFIEHNQTFQIDSLNYQFFRSFFDITDKHQSTEKRLLEVIVSFLNCQGGIIFFGFQREDYSSAIKVRGEELSYKCKQRFEEHLTSLLNKIHEPINCFVSSQNPPQSKYYSELNFFIDVQYVPILAKEQFKIDDEKTEMNTSGNESPGDSKSVYLTWKNRRDHYATEQTNYIVRVRVKPSHKVHHIMTDNMPLAYERNQSKTDRVSLQKFYEMTSIKESELDPVRKYMKDQHRGCLFQIEASDDEEEKY